MAALPGDADTSAELYSSLAQGSQARPALRGHQVEVVRLACPCMYSLLQLACTQGLPYHRQTPAVLVIIVPPKNKLRQCCCPPKSNRQLPRQGSSWMCGQPGPNQLPLRQVQGRL